MPTGDYYISVTGTIQQQTNPALALGLRAAGFMGPFATIAAAKAALPGGKTLTGLAASAPGEAASGVESLIKPFTQRALWVRIAEGVLGLLLIIVAVAELAKGTPVGALAKKTPLLFA
jgi:hypothetical protein